MSHQDESLDPIDVTADAFRTALGETPHHLRPLVRALADTTENTLTAAHHAKYEHHALIRENFRACRESLHKAIIILQDLENLPDQLFDAEPA